MTRPLLLLVLALACCPALFAQERILARRLEDTVAVRRGPDRLETVLYSFASSADLAAGDELEQGSSGQSELYLSGGGLVELYDQGHAIVLRLDPQGDVLRFPWLTIASMTSTDRTLICELPGGVSCRLLETQMEVRTEPGRLRIRNRGSQPIYVSGTISIERGAEGATVLELGQGQEAIMPLVRYISDPPGSLRDAWSDLTLRHNGGFALSSSEGSALSVSLADDPEAPRDDVLTIGGVRTRLPADTLMVQNHRREIPESVDLYEVLQRISGTPEIISPDAVDELLLRFSADQLRAMGARITEEQELRAQKAAGGGVPIPAPEQSAEPEADPDTTEPDSP